MATNTDGKELEGQLEAVSEALGIPQMTMQTTRVRFDRLEAEPDVDDEALAGVAPATLALSVWKDGLPITDTEILEAWAEEAGQPAESMPDPETFQEHVRSVAAALDVDEVPPQPTDLIWQYGETLDLGEEFVAAATRLLRNIYETEPKVVANGTQPDSTVAAVLSLAADANDGEPVTLRELGDVSGTGEVTVRNRYRALREAYDGPIESTTSQATAADGTGTASEREGDGQPASESAADGPASAGDGAATEEEPDDAGAEPSEPSADDVDDGAPLTVEDVEDSIDALTEDLSIDPSVRLFARGMASDAVGDVQALGPGEVGAAAVVAGARREEAELDATDVADSAQVSARSISHALDRLDEAIDVDVPRRDPADLVDEFATKLGLPETAREESQRALRGFDVNDSQYTARELAAGAVAFAVTVGSADVDVGAVAGAAGADRAYVEDVMGEVLIGQCLGIVRGDIAYEECSWTVDLLDTEVSDAVGGADAALATSIAQTYIAGREGTTVDGDTLDVLLGAE